MRRVLSAVTAILLMTGIAGFTRVDPAGARPHRDEPTVIGHRGASGYRPEHTLAAYELAIRQCADFVEPDLVSTADGVLVARHENEIGGTTDVAAHPEFAARRTTKIIDGRPVTGWFTEDFTFAELRTLRARERLPAVRPQNTAFDGQFPIPSLQEVIDLARRSRTCDGRPVGIYPETKHPSYFDSIGLSLEEPLVRTLHRNGYRGRHAPVIVQSFEVGNLQDLDRMTSVRLVQLIDCAGSPWDLASGGEPRTYADLVTPGLRFVDRYADGIGVCKNVMIPRDAQGNLLAPSPVIADAHRQGLVVHGWTFRVENQFSRPVPCRYRPQRAWRHGRRDPSLPGRRDGRLLHRPTRPGRRGSRRLTAPEQRREREGGRRRATDDAKRITTARPRGTIPRGRARVPGGASPRC